MFRSGKIPALFLLIALIAAAALPGQEADADFAQKIRELVEQVRKGPSTPRKKAEEELVRMGPRALAILREEHVRGEGEFKARLDGVIRKIERDRRQAIALGKSVLVRLSAKDKPIEELWAELAKSTGVPIEAKGAEAGATASIEADDLSLWDAVDRICKANGKLAWNVSYQGIVVRGDAYEPPLMSTASGYALLIREYLRRPGDSPGSKRDTLDSEAWVAGPPGVVSIARYLTYETLIDDRGTNLLKGSGGSSFTTSVGGYKILPALDGDRPFYETVADLLDPTPAKEAVRVKLCKGVAVVRAVVDLKKTVEIRGAALKKGAKAAATGLSIKVDELSVSGREIRMEIEITDSRVGGKRDRNLFYTERGGGVVLRDSGGWDLGAKLEPTTGSSTFSGPGAPSNETTRFKVEASLKSETPLVAIEIWEPSEIEEIKIPFDLKDIPIRKAK